jgi:hypothetical protein
MESYLLYSLTFMVIGLLGLLVWKGFAPDRTFSQKAATSTLSIWYYIVLFAVALVPLYLFFADYFIPLLGLSSVFHAGMFVSLLCQFVCTLLPERGSTVLAHRIVTGISGILLLPLLAMVGLSQTITQTENIVTFACVTVMSALLVVGLMSQKGHRYALLLQVSYYVLFFVPIILITY